MNAKNIVDIEGKALSFEENTLSEEQARADKNFAHLREERKSVRVSFPNVGMYDVASAGEDLADLQYKKTQNRTAWAKLEELDRYISSNKLYVGHIRYNDGGERFFMDNPQLASKLWEENGHNIILINVDDRRYSQDIKAWGYPEENPLVAYSRNVTMHNEKVLAVDIKLDRGNAAYEKITDNYLRNALIRNKDKAEIESIIQTIQQEQDRIRSLSKNQPFIVQGCAGSGKTMVLLHRLRYLIFNRDIGLNDYYYLVPSISFKRYIESASEKFRIRNSNIQSFQAYYRLLLDKDDKNAIEENELNFAPAYLERIYSKEFIQENYREMFRRIITQSNKLIEICDLKINDWLFEETKKTADAIERTKETSLSNIEKLASVFKVHNPQPLNEYSDIPDFSNMVADIIAGQRERLSLVEIDTDSISVSPDDVRITEDPMLSQLTAEVEEERAQVRRASIFTRRSHENKLVQLTEKRTEYYQILVQHIREEEKEKMISEARDLQNIYDGLTLIEAEKILEGIRSEYAVAESKIKMLADRKDHIEDYVSSIYHEQIDNLNCLIDASSSFGKETDNLVAKLATAKDVIKNYLHTGSMLYGSISKLMSGKDLEKMHKECTAFVPRTENEAQAYINNILLGNCKKAIKREFNIKICHAYKHYWYLSLYCRYLVYGNEGKGRKYIYVDEAQDLSTSELELLYKFNSKETKDGGIELPVFNVFGDVNQVISSYGIKDWDSIDYISNRFILEENFRNTNQIIEYCNVHLPVHMKEVGVDMDPVEEYNSIGDIRASTITQNGATFIVKDECAAEDLKEALAELELADYQMYTVKQAKGLEFKTVFVVSRDMTDNEKYVACTRAMAKLYVIKSMPAVTNPNVIRVLQGDDDISPEEQ